MWQEKLFFDAPIFVQYDCTNACNLACRHCITSSGKKLENELNTEEALNLIRELASLKIFQIGFSGGEALIREDIFLLMETARKLGLNIQLTTNATLIDKNIAKKLKALNPVTIGISMEGATRQSYGYFRGYENYERFLKGVKALVEEGLPVKIKTAVSRANINELEEIVKFAYENKIESVDMFLFYPEGRGKKLRSIMLERAEIKRFITKINELRKKWQGKVSIEVEDKPNAFLVDKELSHATCGAGVYWAEVLANGDVVPCIFLKELKAGNVREKSFKEIWESKIWDSFRDRTKIKGKCKECEHFHACGGGCRANAYLFLGDIEQEDVLCWYGE